MKSFSSSVAAIASAFALLVAIVAFLTDAATITGITPKQGSLLGGTRLTVTGTGFDIRGRSNDIFIGEGVRGTFCDPVPNECTPMRIVCLTDVPGNGVMPLSVRSFGFLADCQVSGGCTFEYTASKTPIVSAVYPEWITWTPQPLTVVGSHFSQGDGTVAFFDFTLHIGEEERCELLGEGVSSGSFSCNVHSMRPGTLPLDLVHGASGRAKFTGPSALLVLPMINDITPSEGSIRGGTTVTISGSSFSNVLIENEVRIHGALCPVTQYAALFIVCRTSAHVGGPTANPATPAWEIGKVQQELWYNLPGGSINPNWFNKVEYLTPQEEIFTSSVENIARSCENCAVRTTFFFYAPEAGDYYFNGAFDDEGELWISEDETPVDRRLEEFQLIRIDVNPFHSRRVLGSTCCSDHKSEAVTLTQGWHWSRVYLKQASGGLKQDLAVTYPNGTKKAFNDIMHNIAYRAPYTPPVSVRVRGVSAVFDAPCWAYGTCRFDYTAAKTAVVSSVTPNTGVIGGTSITLTGSGFDTTTTAPALATTCFDNATQCGGGACGGCSQTECGLFATRCEWVSNACKLRTTQQDTCRTWSRNIVSVCGTQCFVTSQTATQIECSVGYGAPAGNCLVEVNVGDNGRAVSAAEVSSTPVVQGVTPAATGPETGGTTITIFGHGFDETEGATTVAINGNACDIVGDVTYYRIACITPAGTGAQSIVVTVRGQVRSTAYDIVSFSGLYNRPGISKTNVPISISPTHAGTRGADRLIISCPGRLFPKDAKITVTFGTSFNAPVLSTAGESIVVSSPQIDSPRKLAASVVIKNNAETVTLHTFNTPEVDFNSVLTSSTQWMNPSTSNRVWLYGDFQPARQKDVKVSIMGQPCKNVDFDPYYNSMTCDAQPKLTTTPALPVIRLYDFAPSGFSSVISAMHHSDQIQQNADSTITIPSGGQYVMTKQHFQRPFAFEADVRPTTTVEASGNNAAIHMRFCFEDPTSTSGYFATIGRDSEGYFGLGRDWSRRTDNKEYTGAFAGIGLDTSSTVKLRVEAFNEIINFYVNGVLAGRINDRAYLGGKLGFGMSNQRFTIGNIKVENLYPLSTQVNVSGVPMRSNTDTVYLSVPFAASSMPTRTVSAGTNVIMYVDTWVSSPRIYALRASDEKVSRYTPLLCTGGLSRTITGAIKFTCSAGSLPAGNYHWLLVSTSHGSAATSYAGSFVASLTGVSPSIGATSGTVITVSGAGFLANSQVKLGGIDCATIYQNERAIACAINGAIPDGSHSVSVVTGAATASSCGSGCTVVVSADPSAPVITGTDLTRASLPRAITITGSNFNSNVNAWIGQDECDVWSRATNKIVIYCTRGNTGAQTVIIRHTATNGVSSFGFTVDAGASVVEPTEGSVNGGAELTIKANMLPAGANSGRLAGRDFNAQGVEAGWNAEAPETTWYCNGENVFGMVSHYDLERSFAGVAAHSAVKISYKLHWKDWQRPYIQIDGDKKYEISYTKRFIGSCVRSSSAESFIAEGWIIVPHSGANLKVAFSNGGTAAYWGIASYAIDTVAAMPQSVKVDGINCPVVSASADGVVCKPTAAIAAKTAAVSLVVDGVERCNGCQYTTSAAKTPVITTGFMSNPTGVSESDTTLPQFASHDNVQVTYSNGKATVMKPTGGNSWNNAWFFSPFALRATDADVVGVKATLGHHYAMIGLTSVYMDGQNHNTLEFALYHENGRLYAYKSGAYVNTLDRASYGDEVQVAYHRDCGCVRATYRPKGVVASSVIFSWDATPSFPLYVAGTLHRESTSYFKNIQLLAPRAQTHRVTFFGSNFQNMKGFSTPDTSAITIGGSSCIDAYVSNGVASCWVTPANAAAATYNNVRIRSIEGDSATGNIVRASFITSPPSITTGSTAGGHQLHFTGSGFTAATTVVIGGQACTVTSWAATYLYCTTTARAPGADLTVVVDTSGNTHTCIGFTDIHRAYSSAATPTCTYTYAAGSTPAITGVPATIAVGSSITIDGTTFLTSEKPRVYIGSTSAMCEVTSYTATQIMCTVPVIAAGPYTLTVNFESVGQASGSTTVNIETSISGLSPSTTGNLGDSVVVLTGAGFGKTSDGATVVVQVGAVSLCKTITRDNTQLTCVTNAGDFAGTIDININGKTASSAAFASSGANIPIISSFAPTLGGKGTFVAIAGSGLDDLNAVKVGTAKCEVLTTAANLATCVIVETVAASQSVTVTSASRGLSAASASSFTGAASLDADSNYLSSPIGTDGEESSVEVKGDGLGTASEMIAKVGSRKCDKSKTNSMNTKFTCSYKPGKDAPTDHNVLLSLFGGGVPNSDSSAFTFTYNNLAVPTVSAISQTMGSAAGMEYITFTGTSFSINPNDMDVRIGKAPCYVTEATSTTQFICQTSEMPIQDGLAVSVIVSGMGRASTAVTFDSRLNIDSVSHTDVSVEGGLELTITGTGFWTIADNKDWRYQRALLKVGTRVCPIVSSTTTQIKCILPATEVLPRVSNPSLVTSYVLPPEELGNAVTYVLNSIDATVNAGAIVNYKHTATPRVTSVSGTTTVTIVGTGLAATGNVVDYAGTTCTVVTESTTQVVCNPAGGYYTEGAAVRVNVPNKGYTAGQSSCGGGSFLTCDGTCINDQNCRYAEWGITTCTDLAKQIMTDTFCHSNGGTDRVGLPFRTDDGTKINFNCPMYSCEGKDCDAYLTIGGIGARISTCGPNPSGPMVKLAPSISSLSHVQSSVYGGLQLTISGSNFNTNASRISINIGGGICTVTSAADNSVVCRTGAVSRSMNGAKVFLYVDRVLASGTLPTLNFIDSATWTPMINSMNPTTFSAGDVVTLSGTGFSTSATVIFGNKVCSGPNADATQVTCTVPHQTTFGGMSVKVDVPGKGYSNSVNGNMRLRVLSLAPTSGSTQGGTRVTLVGSGFTKDTRINFGSCETTFVSFTEGSSSTIVDTGACGASLQHATPVDGSSTGSSCGNSCRFNFNSAVTPNIVSASFGGGTATITTSNIASAPATNDVKVTFAGVDCTVTSANTVQIVCNYANPAAGTYNVRLHIANIGYATLNSGAGQFISSHVVTGINPTTGSLGGGQRITITGTGFSATPANNKVTVGLSGPVCTPVSSSYSQIICDTGANAADLTDTIRVAIVDSAATSAPPVAASAASYTYDSGISPTVTSITPARGSTAGGTILTLTGTMLNTAGITVSIAGVACVVEGTPTATEYMCKTGAHTTMLESTVVKVATTSNGDAVNSQTYQYVDLWSRFTTWGNTPPPVRGDSVVIGEGTTVMVDYSPPRFYLVIVMGHLIFDWEKDIDFDCTFIMINFGRFTVGTPEKPYLKKATITLYGDRLTPEIPVHGSKVIALRHGALDIHGAKRQPTWTRLASTAAEKTSKIAIRGPVDWKTGEFIFIASTDFHHEHTEHRMITGVEPADGQAATVTLTLEYPLKYEHYGQQQCFSADPLKPLCVDEIAEVGLLTRNIVIQGDRNSMNIGFGGTMFLMPLGENKDRYARLSYVELRQVGQQFIVGRYPVHYHVTHEASNSYVNGTAVHQALNRAFSIHGIQNNTYVNNVAYDVQGHAFFIEDGSERWNVIDNNFVAHVKVSTSNLNTDLTPANYWIVSASNKITNNAAGGGDAYGYWISPFHPHSTGPTHSTSICPHHHPLWEFNNNVAHSNHKYGFNIFKFWFPKKVECDANSEDEVATLHTLTAYKNQIWGVTYGNHDQGVVGAITFENVISADNGLDHPDGAAFWIEVINARNMTNGVRNSVMIAKTGNQPNTRKSNRRGVNLAKGDNFFVENVTFVNYVDSKDHGFEPQAWASRMSLCFPYGWEAVASQISWVNSPNRILYRFHHHGIINDLDGTVAGSPNTQIITKSPIMDDTICGAATASYVTRDALICPDSYKVRRMGPVGVSEIWRDQRWVIDSREEVVPVITRNYIMTAPVQRQTSINFQAVKVPDTWAWSLSGPTFTQPGEKFMYWVRHNETRHHVYAKFNGVTDKNYKRAPPTMAETTSGYSYSNETNIFQALMVYPTRSMSVSSYNCPEEGCPMPPLPPGSWDTPCRPYNLGSSWLSGQVPVTNLQTDLQIFNEESVCLGAGFTGTCDANTVMTYEYRLLRVEGSIQFRNEHCPCDGATVHVKVGAMWIRQGGLLVGNAEEKLTRCRFRLSIMEPDWNDPASVGPVTVRPWGARSLILESGMLMLNGNVPTPHMARLAATAGAGATSITLDRELSGWNVGDWIYIAGTQRRKMYTQLAFGDDPVAMGVNQRERRQIASISADRRTITFAGGLRHSHFGTVGQTINNKNYAIGAEVVLMNRNIIVDGGNGNINEIAAEPKVKGGWVLNAGCTPDVYEGCAVWPDRGWPMSEEKPGYVRIEGAWLRDAGQGGILNGAGVHIDGLVSAIPDASYSFFRFNVLERFFHTGMMIRHSTNGLKVEHNTIIDPEGDGIAVIGTDNFITGNTIVGSGIPYSCEDLYHIFPECRAAGIRVHGQNVVQDNIVAGHLTVGILTDGDSCDKELSFSNNWLHSNRDGLLIYDGILDSNMKYPSRDIGSCRKVGGVHTYWNGDHGVIAWYAAGSLTVENVVAVENTIGVAALLTARSSLPTAVSSTATYRNMVVAGFFDGMQCRNSELYWKCKKSLVDSADWCNRFLHHAGAHRKIGTAGILETVFVSAELGIGRTKGEKKFRWTESDSYATMIGQAIHDGVVFANFDGSDACGLRNIAFHSNVYSNDTFKHHIFRNIQWSGTVQNGGEYWATRTYGPAPMITSEREPTWYMDFDNTKFGAFWPDAPNKNLIIDADGSFTRRGAKSSIVADESLVRPNTFETYKYHGQSFQAGSLMPANSGCTWKSEWNAHMCNENYEWSSLTIDSLAEDRLTRRPGPVVLCKGDGMVEINGHPLCQGGSVQFASGPVMKGKVQRATLDRLSRYKFHVMDRDNYTLSFRGSPPAWMRLIMHDHEHTSAGANSGITVNLRFFGLNSQLRQVVYVNGVRQKPNVGFGFPWTYGQTWPGPRDNIGTHFHNKLIMDRGTDPDGLDQTQYNVIYFTMRPGSVVEIKAEEIIQLNMDISVPLESFFNEKDNFVVMLATQLNIDSSRLKFANIVPGGTLSANTAGFVSSRGASALNSNAGNTTVILGISKRDGDGQLSYNNGRSISDFPKIMLAISNIGDTVGTFKVDNVKAEILEVEYPLTPITVQEGTPYIACNASKIAAADSPTAVNGNENVNSTEMQSMLQQFFVKNYPTTSPYNVTQFEEAGVGNVWHNSKTGWSRVILSLGYQENIYAIRDGLLYVNPHLQSNATATKVFPNHRVYGCRFENNGWTDGNNQRNKKSNAALIFGLAIGLSLFFLILIGGGIAYYYFVVRPRNAAKEVEKELDEFEFGDEGWSLEDHPEDQYDELGRPYFYDEEGQPYYYDEDGRAHYYYDTHDSEAPMYDELGRQYFYDEQGQPYFLDEDSNPKYYYEE